MKLTVGKFSVEEYKVKQIFVNKCTRRKFRYILKWKGDKSLVWYSMNNFNYFEIESKTKYAINAQLYNCPASKLYLLKIGQQSMKIC